MINVIKSTRLGWAGQAVRKGEKTLPEKVLWTNPGGNRGRCRPKSSWIEGVEEDTMRLGCRNLRADTQDRGYWRHLLEEAKDHPGL